MDQHFRADFHGFILDSTQGLSFAGKPLSLHPKEFNMLLVLVKQAGIRVSKEELIEQVWHKTAISDESISRCLSVLKATLRKASPGAEALIKTEYGQGYRFIGQVGKPASLVNEETFFLQINSTNNLFSLKDAQGRWQIANSAVLSLFGLNQQLWQGKTDTELAECCFAQYQNYFLDNSAADQMVWQGNRVQTSEIELPNSENPKLKQYLQVTKTPMFEVDGSRKALLTSAQDITERKEHERRTRITDRVLAASNEAVLICDAQRNIVYVNEIFTRTTGYSFAEVFGKNPRFLSSGEHDQTFFQDMWWQINHQGTWHGEIWDKRKNGEIYLKWLNISSVHDSDGKVCNYVGVFSDISKHKKDEARLVFLAYHDALTSLPNRLLLRDRFNQLLRLNNRRDGNMMAILFLDLDEFKAINDGFGHEVGDQLLMEVARRLSACVREIDTVCRLGGDEFVIVLADVPDYKVVSIVAEKLLKHLNQSFPVDEHDISTSASIGIAVYPHDGEDFEKLLKVADTAMYHAKNSGRNGFKFFIDGMHTQPVDQHRISNGLTEALSSHQFMLYYQPQFDLNSGELVGLEALLRWNHPTSGVVFPNTFIHVAEQTGQIVPIGEWVLGEACRQLKAWQQAGHNPVRISVNMSKIQFTNSDVVGVVAKLSEQYALNPACLEFEMPEASLLHDVERMAAAVEHLKNLNFGLSLSDFGTCHASLAYMRQYRFDKLKIDQSFVRNLEHNPHDIQVIKSMVELANGLGLTTVAEGVETQGQQQILQREGCHQAQGFLFSVPLPAQQVVKHFKV